MTASSVYNKALSSANSSRVLVISDAAPHRNGVGAYYADLLDDLAGQVASVKMISPEIIGNEWRGSWMLPLPGDRTQKLCLPNALEISRQMSAFRPKVVVIPTPGLFGLFGALVARKQGVPVICGFHTWFEKLAGLYWNRVQGGVTRTYFEYVNKALFKLSDVILANSHEMVDIARTNGGQNVHLMGTPISRAMLAQPLKPAPKTVAKLLFVGRLAAEKNIDALLAAARALPQMNFTIAGDGPEKTRLLEAATGLANVAFAGWVDRPQVIELLDSHDALVLPSTVESFGTVAMEAMMRQRLVLVSSACGITEWPQLRAALTVVTQQSSIATELRQLASLSEFELFSRCQLARKAALDHVRWNQNLWLSHIDSLQQQARSEIDDNFLVRVTRSLWRHYEK